MRVSEVNRIDVLVQPASVRADGFWKTRRSPRCCSDVPDFPKRGIVFKDITPGLSDPVLFRARLISSWRMSGLKID